jgi:hypothetical protein
MVAEVPAPEQKRAKKTLSKQKPSMEKKPEKLDGKGNYDHLSFFALEIYV